MFYFATLKGTLLYENAVIISIKHNFRFLGIQSVSKIIIIAIQRSNKVNMIRCGSTGVEVDTGNTAFYQLL